MVFKKDLTPLSKKGSVTKHRGKGATEQRTTRGMTESLSGPASLGRATGSYPKASPAPPPAPAPMPGAMPVMGPLPPEE